MKYLSLFIICCPIISYAQTAHEYNMSLLSKEKHISQSSEDSRRGVKLTKKMAEHQLKNMRSHLDAVSMALDGYTKSDFILMEKSATKLASSPQMQMMCENMGKATPGFTEMGLALHKAADKMLEAAKNKNKELFMLKLGKTLHTCTSCHTTFKQEIVSEQDMHNAVIQMLSPAH